MALAARQEGLGAVLALVAPHDPTPALLGDLGRDLLRAWLGLARLGWGTHPLTQLLDCPETEAPVQATVAGSSASGGRVVKLWRVGRPTTVPARSARRDSD